MDMKVRDFEMKLLFWKPKHPHYDKRNDLLSTKSIGCGFAISRNVINFFRWVSDKMDFK